MTESVQDEITVRLVYEGRAAKVLLDNSELAKIEQFYEQCGSEGTSEHQIEEGPIQRRTSTTAHGTVPFFILGGAARLKIYHIATSA